MACDRPPPVPSVHQTLDEMDFERGLWYAALTGDLPRVRTLLEKGKDPNVEDKSGYTPLHYAARCGFSSICALLLERGAEVNKATRAGGSTALHRAALAGNCDTITVLIKYGANLHAQDADGRIPLHRAVEANQPTAVALLLEASPLSCTFKDKSGKTARNYIAPNDKIMDEIFNIIDKPQVQPKKRSTLMKDDELSKQVKNPVQTTEKTLKKSIPKSILDKPLSQNIKKSVISDQTGQMNDHKQINLEKRKAKATNVQDKIVERIIKEKEDNPGIQNTKRSVKLDQNGKVKDYKQAISDIKKKENHQQEKMMEGQLLKTVDEDEIQPDFKKHYVKLKDTLPNDEVDYFDQTTPEKKITQANSQIKFKEGLMNVIEKSGIQSNGNSRIEDIIRRKVEKSELPSNLPNLPETKIKKTDSPHISMATFMNAINTTRIPADFKCTAMMELNGEDQDSEEAEAKIKLSNSQVKTIEEGVKQVSKKTGIPNNLQKSVTSNQSGQDEEPNQTTPENNPQDKTTGGIKNVADKTRNQTNIKRTVTKESELVRNPRKTTPEKKIKPGKESKKC